MNKLFDTKPPGGWTMLALVGLALLATISLSVWQLTKGIAKHQERTGYIARLQEEAIEETDYEEQESAYRQLRLRGRYIEDRSFIVGYQRHNQVPGYWIVTPFRTNYGKFLVNRGWLPIQQSFLEIPEFETPHGTVEITGVIWTHKHFQSDRSYDKPGWPKRVKRLNLKKMAEITEAYEDEIRLLADNPGSFTPIQLLVENEPAMHWGYAFQWLLIGGLVVSAYWFFGVRRGEVGNR
ncbi:MAG: SURF1 family protein [Gammaproteobacteria bacterium]|nr:SURF1 family protein [Gammaproteobacteria bacterium]